MNIEATAVERFWDKVDRRSKDECWEWTASTRSGYGAFKLGRKTVLAHRIAYTLERGDIPDGILVCHTCDNRICVNPNHLFLVTHYDNWLDAVQKGRMPAVPPGTHRWKAGERPINHKQPPPGTGWCCACQEFLPEDRFCKNRRQWNGLHMYCKECVRANRRKSG